MELTELMNAALVQAEETRGPVSFYLSRSVVDEFKALYPTVKISKAVETFLKSACDEKKRVS